MDNFLIDNEVRSTIRELIKSGFLKTNDLQVVQNYINKKYPKPFASKYEYNEYMASTTWNRERERQFEIHGSKCEICGYSGPGLNVHHITYERGRNPHEDDFAVLCPACHEKVHRIVSSTWDDDYTSYRKILDDWYYTAKRDIGKNIALRMNVEWPNGIPGRNKMRAACIVRDTLMLQHNLQFLNPRHDEIMRNLVKNK